MLRGAFNYCSYIPGLTLALKTDAGVEPSHKYSSDCKQLYVICLTDFNGTELLVSLSYTNFTDEIR